VTLSHSLSKFSSSNRSSFFVHADTAALKVSDISTELEELKERLAATEKDLAASKAAEKEGVEKWTALDAEVTSTTQTLEGSATALREQLTTCQAELHGVRFV
jgi:chromosome segregation ATPase